MDGGIGPGSPSTSPSGSPLKAGDREELERLRAEVARLKAEPGRGRPPGRPRPGRGRRAVRSTFAVVLIVVGCLLSPLSVVSVWARGEVTDTDRYVDTVAPLADDPDVQQAIAANITNTVFRYVDVEGLTTQIFDALAQRDVLPPRLAVQLPALAVPIANGVRSFAEDQVATLVRSDVFADAWAEANREAHEQLVAALTGEGDGSVEIDDAGGVRVNMAAFLATVKERLVSSGFQLAERVPAVDAEFVVFQSAELTKVQRGFDLLNTLGLWMPFVCLALVGLGIYLIHNHRLAFIGAGLGVALAMLATAAALALVRRIYLDGVPPDVLPLDAAAALFDTLVRFLREAIRAAALLGLVVAAAAFLTGHSVTATTLRRWIVSGFASARGALREAGVSSDSATGWVAARARALRVAVVIAAFAVLLLQRYRTPALVAWLTIGVLVALAVIQFFATPPRSRPSSAARAADPRHPVPAHS